MHTLATKAVVTKADGSLFYREEHEWPNLDDAMLKWFTDAMDHLNAFAVKVHGKKEDSANLTVELTATVDGGTPMVQSFTGVTYHALTKFEREAHKFMGQLVDLGDAQAKHKK